MEDVTAEEDSAAQLSHTPSEGVLEPELGLVILQSKVTIPALRPDHLSRPRLVQALDRSLSRRLTVVTAPPGAGKTRLLAEWCSTSTRAQPTAWLTLSERENHPVTFWTYLLTALSQVTSFRFDSTLEALSRPGVSLLRVVLPQVLNELWRLDQDVVLVLDDVHSLTDRVTLDSLRFVIDRLPPRLHVVLASRANPPVSLARLRVRGALTELHANDLYFTAEEATAYLNGTMGLELAQDGVMQLVERTEGWPAALHLAALAVRDHPDRHAFIATFTGQHRYLVDFLGVTMLDQLPDDDRSFLLETAILAQLSAPLCDAVNGRSDSAERLRRLAQQNLFLPLDDHWQWFRCHQILRDFFLSELTRRTPERITELHRAAAGWYQAAGEANAAMHHALAALDFALAGRLYLEYAYPLPGEGRLQNLVQWMDALPDAELAARPAVALATAWVAGVAGRPPEEVMQRVAMAEAGGAAGASATTDPSLEAAIARIRATYITDNVGAAVAAAETALAASSNPMSTGYIVARSTLGFARYLAGRSDEAEAPLVEAVRAPMAPQQAGGTGRALATLALVCLDLGEEDRAEALVRQAERFAEERGLLDAPSSWLLWVAMGQVLIREAHLAEAEAVLAQRLEPHLERLRGWPLFYALALLTLAPARHGMGHQQAAQSLLEEARRVLRRCSDAGMLPRLLAEAERRVGRAVMRQAGLREDLSEGEVRVLRLLASDLTQREIGHELYVSLNTVKSHLRGIYTKLDVDVRQEAVARARALGLIP